MELIQLIIESYPRGVKPCGPKAGRLLEQKWANVLLASAEEEDSATSVLFATSSAKDLFINEKNIREGMPVEAVLFAKNMRTSLEEIYGGLLRGQQSGFSGLLVLEDRFPERSGKYFSMRDMGNLAKVPKIGSYHLDTESDLKAEIKESRKNHVIRVSSSEEEAVVIKIGNKCNKEADRIDSIKNMFQSIPVIIERGNGYIVFEDICGKPLSELLDSAEQRKCAAADCARWLARFHWCRKERGREMLKGDCAPANFIITSDAVYGIDFEEAPEGSFLDELTDFCFYLSTWDYVEEKERIEIIEASSRAYFEISQAGARKEDLDEAWIGSVLRGEKRRHRKENWEIISEKSFPARE